MLKRLFVLILLAILVCGCIPSSGYNFYDRLDKREPYKSYRRQLLEEMEDFLIERRMQKQSDMIIGKHRWKSNQSASGLQPFDYEKPSYQLNY